MKQLLLDELKKHFDAVHGCYRPHQGTCFYLASQRASADHENQQGRRFVAVVEGSDGMLHERISLTFLVGAVARSVKAELIGDFGSFCEEVGLERLREMLEIDPTTERNEKVLLTRDTEDIAFRRPDSVTMIRRYKALRHEIVHILADRHARGHKRVPAAELHDALCHEPGQVNRALNELVERKLVRELNHSEGMRLTSEGQREVEAALPVPQPVAFIAPNNPGLFDVFVSYASEDHEIAESLHRSLEAHGYSVWRDRGQLTLGDSLTVKISEGLARSRYGVVILSAAFLGKNWPQAELNALQSRAISEGNKVIIPIRRDLGHEELAKHFPLLGDKLTMGYSNNHEEVVREIVRAIGIPSSRSQ